MNCYIDKKNILNSLKKIQDITERNPIMPMSSNMLIEVKNKLITIKI